MHSNNKTNYKRVRLLQVRCIQVCVTCVAAGETGRMAAGAVQQLHVPR